MTGFAKRKEDTARPKLLALYQAWMRAYTVRLHPELELLWQLSDSPADRQVQSLSHCSLELAKLTGLLQQDARHLLLLPDFKSFVQKRLKPVSPRSAWEPEATTLSVANDPKQWVLLNLEETLQLEHFQLLPERDMEEDKEAFVAYSYSLALTLGDFEANLEEVLVGRVYAEPARFVPQPFKRQQEAIAEQLTAEFAQQGGLSSLLVEEISCCVCYAALAFALAARIAAFEQETGVELEPQHFEVEEELF